uniref:Uncharacterized protein n=1 Tax=Arundo donax TaxID=35708 RepID=A0A0A9GZB6_ARUDO
MVMSVPIDEKLFIEGDLKTMWVHLTQVLKGCMETLVIAPKIKNERMS